MIPNDFCQACMASTTGNCGMHTGARAGYSISLNTDETPTYEDGFSDGYSRGWQECWEFLMETLNEKKPEVAK